MAAPKSILLELNRALSNKEIKALTEHLRSAGAFKYEISNQHKSLRVDIKEPFGYWGSEEEANTRADKYAARIHKLIISFIEGDPVAGMRLSLEQFCLHIERHCILHKPSPSQNSRLRAISFIWQIVKIIVDY